MILILIAIISAPLLSAIAVYAAIVPKDNPYSQMVDLLPPKSIMWDNRSVLDDAQFLQGFSAEGLLLNGFNPKLTQGEPLFDLDKLVSDIDDGKTDRYIVKYKPDKESVFVNKVRGLVCEITPIERIANEAIDSSRAISISSDSKFEIVDSNKINQVFGNSSFLNDLSLIILDEKVYPTEFATKLKSLGVTNDIIFVQPDFKLQLDSLDNSESRLTDLISNGNKINNSSNEISVLVAVIDTGMDITHSSLVEYAVSGWNFPASNDKVYDAAFPSEYSHGTHVAGIISGIAYE